MRITIRLIFLLALLTSLVACVYGGQFVSSNMSAKVLLTYESRGPAPPNVKWYLVQTEKGLAILEKDSSNSSGTLVEQAFTDRGGYHFVVWAEFIDVQSTAFEFIVPLDISKPAVRYAYQAGDYTRVKENGVYRPVPHNDARKVVTRLIPVLKK